MENKTLATVIYILKQIQTHEIVATDELLHAVKKMINKVDRDRDNDGYYEEYDEYAARTKHLVKLIWQQQEIKIEKCPDCENEKWVDYNCPNIECSKVRRYAKMLKGVQENYPGFANIIKEEDN